MKCQKLFSEKNKKNTISLSSAVLAQCDEGKYLLPSPYDKQIYPKTEQTAQIKTE